MPRSGKAWAPEMRKRIQERLEAGEVAKRLMDHFLGDLELSQTQIKAVEILMKKVLPDQKAMELTGADGKDLFTSVLREVVDAKTKD